MKDHKRYCYLYFTWRKLGESFMCSLRKSCSILERQYTRWIILLMLYLKTLRRWFYAPPYSWKRDIHLRFVLIFNTLVQYVLAGFRLLLLFHWSIMSLSARSTHFSSMTEVTTCARYCQWLKAVETLHCVRAGVEIQLNDREEYNGYYVSSARRPCAGALVLCKRIVFILFHPCRQCHHL